MLRFTALFDGFYLEKGIGALCKLKSRLM